MAKKFGKDSYKSPWGDVDMDTGEITPSKRAPSCYESHPGLKLIALDGTEATIYGGSCSHPVVKDADIYIGFDKYSMQYRNKSWPWESKGSEVVEFLFPITDMAAPSNAADFKAMIDWVCNQLQTGKKIHAGCIGGHGRTGTFLSAVVAQFMGHKDAITYVRENYCDRAVESGAQVDFLIKHYGVAKVKGAKTSVVSSGGTRGWSAASSIAASPWGAAPAKTTNVVPFTSKRTIAPVPSKRSIW